MNVDNKKAKTEGVHVDRTVRYLKYVLYIIYYISVYMIK